MDPLTQGLLGAAAAQATVGRWLGRRAGFVGMVGGMLADLDVLIRSDSDPLLGLEYHRHFTHAFVFVPIGGLVAGALLLLVWGRLRKQWRATLCAGLIGYATHGLLDAFTSYGTLLWWPFSDRRVSWDAIAIVDPVFTLCLLVGVVWSFVSDRQRAARIGLALCGMYLCLGLVQHGRAMETQAILAEARGHDIRRGRVLPAMGSLLVWRSVYETDGILWADALRLGMTGHVGVRVGREQLSVTNQRFMVGDQERSDAYKRFYWFADGYTGIMGSYPGVIVDGRYSASTEGFTPLWGLWLYGWNITRPVSVVGLHRFDVSVLRSWWWDVINAEGMFESLEEVIQAEHMDRSQNQLDGHKLEKGE